MSVAPEAVPYIDAFRRRGRDSNDPAWLGEKRAAALANFAALGFPTRREEAWRFSDLRPLARGSFTPAATPTGTAAAPEIAPWRLDAPTHRLVFVDGAFQPSVSEIGTLPPGAWLASTAKTLAERPDLVKQALVPSDEAGRQPFAALNAAFFADGFVLALEPGVVLERPVEVIHLACTGACSFHLRNAVSLGAGARARLVESFAGAGAAWTNSVTAVALGEAARLAHIRVQDEDADGVHFALTRAVLSRGAAYDAFALALGARLSRQEFIVRYEGEDATSRVDGAFLLRGEQEATTATFIDHAVPACTTRELFKGVAEDRAHGVFMGRIAVQPQAQRTDAQQVNRNLLLSRRATIDTKPELEILADDVKCSHGATVGDLDEEALFYLRARGIALEEARRMLIEAFAAEALDHVEEGAIRDRLGSHVARWLARVTP